MKWQIVALAVISLFLSLPNFLNWTFFGGGLLLAPHSARDLANHMALAMTLNNLPQPDPYISGVTSYYPFGMHALIKVFSIASDLPVFRAFPLAGFMKIFLLLSSVFLLLGKFGKKSVLVTLCILSVFGTDIIAMSWQVGLLNSPSISQLISIHETLLGTPQIVSAAYSNFPELGHNLRNDMTLAAPNIVWNVPRSFGLALLLVVLISRGLVTSIVLSALWAVHPATAIVGSLMLLLQKRFREIILPLLLGLPVFLFLFSTTLSQYGIHTDWMYIDPSKYLLIFGIFILLGVWAAVENKTYRNLFLMLAVLANLPIIGFGFQAASFQFLFAAFIGIGCGIWLLKGGWRLMVVPLIIVGFFFNWYIFSLLPTFSEKIPLNDLETGFWISQNTPPSSVVTTRDRPAQEGTWIPLVSGRSLVLGLGRSSLERMRLVDRVYSGEESGDKLAGFGSNYFYLRQGDNIRFPVVFMTNSTYFCRIG